ncbi:hypothetical protein ACFL1T_01820 [Chlamydiota bacterium]
MNMSKKQIELIVIGVCGLIFIIIIFFVLIPTLSKKKGHRIPSKKTPQKILMQQIDQQNLRKKQELRDIKELPIASATVDPFKPLAQKIALDHDPLFKDVTLDGISFVGDNKFAIINNTITQLGDLINGGTVTAIQTNTVTIELDGKKHILKLKGE